MFLQLRHFPSFIVSLCSATLSYLVENVSATNMYVIEPVLKDHKDMASRDRWFNGGL